MSLQTSLNLPLSGGFSTGTKIDTTNQITINASGSTIMMPFYEYYLQGAHTLIIPQSASLRDKYTVIMTNTGQNFTVSVENTSTQIILFHQTADPQVGTSLQSANFLAALTMVCTLEGLWFQVLSTNGSAFTLS